MTDEQLMAEISKILSTERDSKGNIQFIDVDVEKTKSNIITFYEALTGRVLSRADPVRLFLLTIAYIIVMQRVIINYTGKMNLLRYAIGDFLEELGYFVGTERLQASGALTTIEITLSQIRAEITHIPKGTRVTAGDNIFFAIIEDVFIPIGVLTAQVIAECTQTGTIGNGYLPGEIKNIVDPIPFVQSMLNTSTSQGGSDTEEDEPYRERIHEAPESFSVAGSDGAYRYWAMTANPLIVDVEPRMYPNPGDVTLYVLLKNGELPGREILDRVLEVCSAEDIRPLTDHVYVEPAQTIQYDLELTYYVCSRDQARASEIRIAVNNAIAGFIVWQKSKLGRDINPSELTKVIVEAGAKRAEIISPTFTSLEKWQVAQDQSQTISFGGIEDD